MNGVLFGVIEEISAPGAMRAVDLRAETPVETATRIAGDAWTALVLREVLFYGKTRFDDFQGALRLNSATLSDRLDRLVGNGLIERIPSRAGSGRRQVYAATPAGDGYMPALLGMAQWGQRWRAGTSDQMLTVVHQDCGEVLGAEVRCVECAGELSARDVDVRVATGYLNRCTSQVRQRAPRLDHLERGGPCPIARTLAEIGDRWRMLVLQQCFFGIKRFDDFRKSLGIAPNILSNRLQRLVAAGLLSTHPYLERPPRFEYHLTPASLDLYGMSIMQWTWSEDLFGVSPGVTLTHKKCGYRVRAQQYCKHCNGQIYRSEITAFRTGIVPDSTR